MKKFLYDEGGSVLVVDTLMATIFILAMTFTVLYFFTIFPQQYTLNTQAQALAKAAEITGGIGVDVDNLRTELEKSGKIDSVEWKANKWLDAKRIPLHTPFTVTVKKVVPITIFKPAFSESYPLKIELSATASGLTEVYYKP